MAFRYIDSSFWEDPFIENTTPECKLVYLYLITKCPNQCGIFEISKKRISFDTGLSADAVQSSLETLKNENKVYIAGNFIYIRNFLKYQANSSPNVKKRIKSELSELAEKAELAPFIKEICDAISIPYPSPIDTPSIPLQYPIDTHPIKGKGKEKEKEKEKEDSNNLPSLLTTFGEKVVNSQAVDPPDSISEAEGEPESEPESETDKDSTQQKKNTVPYQQIIDAYNRILPELPKSKGGKEVRKHIRARWRESPERQNMAWWEQYFKLVRDQPFLLGDNDRGWTANLQWLVRPQNMEKVLEMHYRSSTRARDPTTDEFVRQGRISATTASNIVAVKEWLERDSDEGDRQEKG